MVSKGVIIGIVVAVIIAGGFFLFSNGSPEAETGTEIEEPETLLCDKELTLGTSWMDSELCNVRDGEVFTIGQFDKPVLLESFAVWCPICTQQQKKTKELHDGEFGDEFISISLDTDPNEDEAIVRSHTNANGFTWRYSVAPAEVTQMLINDLTLAIINPPTVPMVLVCPDGNFRRLSGTRVRSAEKLREEIEAGC